LSVRLFVLANTHMTMRAEETLRTHGIRCHTIPKPRVVRADCGLALVCPTEAGDRARSMLTAAGIEPVADLTYAPKRGGLFDDG
jgi:hypothetical protein